ncbi:MAG: FMN-binding protein [Candidatus Cloacimonetes bacterium]|nr:FMN-binding protein [Candidatus Cloacimonadota bacterium]
MRNDNIYIFGYAGAVCLVCSILLSLAATKLQPLQAENMKLDIRKNIMIALGIIDTEARLSKEELNQKYSSVNGMVLDLEGNVVDGLNPENLTEKDLESKLPIFQKMENGVVKGYAFPIVGKGLWSTLKGYLALEADTVTVKGLTFYQHGETPGLGAEIEQSWFTNNFKAKKVRDNLGNLVGVTVAKGKATDSGRPIEHVVDGISGATITANGVTDMFKVGLVKYDAYFERVRQGGH